MLRNPPEDSQELPPPHPKRSRRKKSQIRVRSTRTPILAEVGPRPMVACFWRLRESSLVFKKPVLVRETIPFKNLCPQDISTYSDKGTPNSRANLNQCCFLQHVCTNQKARKRENLAAPILFSSRFLFSFPLALNANQINKSESTPLCSNVLTSCRAFCKVRL